MQPYLHPVCEMFAGADMAGKRGVLRSSRSMTLRGCLLSSPPHPGLGVWGVVPAPPRAAGIALPSSPVGFLGRAPSSRSKALQAFSAVAGAVGDGKPRWATTSGGGGEPGAIEVRGDCHPGPVGSGGCLRRQGVLPGPWERWNPGREWSPEPGGKPCRSINGRDPHE